MRNIFITRNRENDNISVYEKEPAVVVTMDRKDLSYLKKLSYANNHVASKEIKPGIFLWVNQSQSQTSKAIQKIASWLNLSVEINF